MSQWMEFEEVWKMELGAKEKHGMLLKAPKKDRNYYKTTISMVKNELLKSNPAPEHWD